LSLGNTGLSRYGCGGSGLPGIREVGHGLRSAGLGSAEVTGLRGSGPMTMNGKTRKMASSRRGMSIIPVRKGLDENRRELYPTTALNARLVLETRGANLGYVL